jgi:hypothetical protein
MRAGTPAHLTGLLLAATAAVGLTVAAVLPASASTSPAGQCRTGLPW